MVCADVHVLAVAPEMLESLRYGFGVDVWSLGVLVCVDGVLCCACVVMLTLVYHTLRTITHACIIHTLSPSPRQQLHHAERLPAVLRQDREREGREDIVGQV
jgi:hypothetical protein